MQRSLVSYREGEQAEFWSPTTSAGSAAATIQTTSRCVRFGGQLQTSKWRQRLLDARLALRIEYDAGSRSRYAAGVYIMAEQEVDHDGASTSTSPRPHRRGSHVGRPLVSAPSTRTREAMAAVGQLDVAGLEPFGRRP